MKISLLILVHDAEKHIEKCVRSLFGQDYDDIEYVFVDDASSDRSMEIVERVLEEYPERRTYTKVIANPHNVGIAQSRNVALDNAAGDYVLYIDSDDSLAQGAVSKLAAYARDTGADIVTFDFYTLYGGRTRRHDEYFSEDRQEYIRALLYRQTRPAMWLKLIRRELFTAHNLRFIPGMQPGQDFCLSPMLAYHAAKIVKLREPLYYYLRHPASISYEFTAEKAKSVVSAADHLASFFAGVPDAQAYQSMIPRMKLRNKIAILQSGGPQAWRFAEGLYEGEDCPRSELGASQRIILWLHGRRMYTAMRLYRNLARLFNRN